jgi:hypothetical protein
MKRISVVYAAIGALAVLALSAINASAMGTSIHTKTSKVIVHTPTPPLDGGAHARTVSPKHFEDRFQTNGGDWGQPDGGGSGQPSR